MLPEPHTVLHAKCYQEASLMHRILFTVIHSHMRLLPMMAAEGGMMIDCVQGVGVGGGGHHTEQGRDGGETRLQIFHRLNEEQTCSIQDGKGEKIIICR